jgi:hypothetical protein
MPTRGIVVAVWVAACPIMPRLNENRQAANSTEHGSEAEALEPERKYEFMK